LNRKTPDTVWEMTRHTIKRVHEENQEDKNPQNLELKKKKPPRRVEKRGQAGTKRKREEKQEKKFREKRRELC